MKLALEILAEENKQVAQDAVKFIDGRYLQQALKDL